MKTSEPKENSFHIQMFQKAKTNKTTGLGKKKCLTLNSYCSTLHVPVRLSMPQLKHFLSLIKAL